MKYVGNPLQTVKIIAYDVAHNNQHNRSFLCNQISSRSSPYIWQSLSGPLQPCTWPHPVLIRQAVIGGRYPIWFYYSLQTFAHIAPPPPPPSTPAPCFKTEQSLCAAFDCFIYVYKVSSWFQRNSSWISIYFLYISLRNRSHLCFVILLEYTPPNCTQNFFSGLIPIMCMWSECLLVVCQAKVSQSPIYDWACF